MQDGCLRSKEMVQGQTNVLHGVVVFSDDACLRRTIALTHHRTSAQVPHRELVKESHVRHLYPLAVIIHFAVIVHFSCASQRGKKLWTKWGSMIG